MGPYIEWHAAKKLCALESDFWVKNLNSEISWQCDDLGQVTTQGFIYVPMRSMLLIISLIIDTKVCS